MAEKSKTDRILAGYVKLSMGYVVNKSCEALAYEVDERTTKRDISDLRCFISDCIAETAGDYFEIEYDRVKCGYIMKRAG